MNINEQIKKEARASFLLFAICVIWHVGFGWGLNYVPIRFAGIPLWWWVSVPGVFVVALIGVYILLTRVFKNFDLDGEA